MPEDAEQKGASYKQLALIAHRAGLSRAERQEWYGIVESVPLSYPHASYLPGRLGAGRG